MVYISIYKVKICMFFFCKYTYGILSICTIVYAIYENMQMVIYVYLLRQIRRVCWFVSRIYKNKYGDTAHDMILKIFDLAKKLD